jgi:membrane protease YdiL (CAAX protease family)
MLSFVDHLFIVLLVVVQPIHGAVTYRRYVRQIEAGMPANRVALYRQTLVLEWAALAVLALAWWLFGRPVMELGMSVPGGIGFWIGCGAVLLAWFWRKATALSEQERASQLDSLGNLVHFLPRPGREYRYFFGLSITAGVVEEIVYRGFMLWYLAHFMPLWAAVLLSSVAFGLGHSYQGLSGGVRTGLVGLVFAVLYVVSGSIWLPILGHALLDILQGAMIVELFRKRTVAAQACDSMK